MHAQRHVPPGYAATMPSARVADPAADPRMRGVLLDGHMSTTGATSLGDLPAEVARRRAVRRSSSGCNPAKCAVAEACPTQRSAGWWRRRCDDPPRGGKRSTTARESTSAQKWIGQGHGVSPVPQETSLSRPGEQLASHQWPLLREYGVVGQPRPRVAGAGHAMADPSGPGLIPNRSARPRGVNQALASRPARADRRRKAGGWSRGCRRGFAGRRCPP